MNKLYRPTDLHDLLERLKVKAKKGLSQNFLIDGNILRKILIEADVTADDVIIEIGPGPGALTQALLQTGAKVFAIEKDPLFAQELAQLQTPDLRLEVFEEDFLEFPLESFLNKILKEGKKAKIVANLPYHITTPILVSLVHLYPVIDSITVMVQKETAVRFTAKKDTADYSSFTLFLQHFSKPRYCFTVPPTCFYPRPNVHSAVVQLILQQPHPLSSTSDFFQLTRRAFQGRRKMLRSSLRELYGKEQIEAALLQLGLRLDSRPEQLSLEEFIQLFDALSSDNTVLR